ncbi:MFS transporter [Peptostreptococcus sp. MV1]|uniref:MFS transporter n=1 Tax=Peptostreptococcus sp. MV1 TaxID=1219626 RepID=UPI000562C4B5|nr:MFS transporter [Peptostreptococcus sp. MV1]
MLRVSKKEKSWILYDWANSAYTMTMLTTILPIYFTAMVGEVGLSKEMATSYWGYTNAIASLVVAVLSPFMGGLADYMGVKKKFFTVFTLLGIIFSGMIAFIPYGQWQLLIVTYIISLIGYSLSNVFYDSFLTDITSEDRMDMISSLGYGFGYIGSTIPFIVCMGIIMAAQKSIIPISSITASKISFFITTMWWLTFTLPMYKNVEQVHGKPYEKFKPQDSMRKLKESFLRVRKNRKAFLFLCAYFFYIDGVDTIIRMAASFGTAVGIGSSTLLVILLVTQFVAFPFAIIYGKLTQIFKGKAMLIAGIGIYIVICIFAFFLKSAREFWILSILVGSSQGGIQALSRSYFAKMIPKENSNEYFGFYNIFGKFAAIMGPFLVGIVTQITGDVRNGVLSLILIFIVGVVLLLKD